MMTEAEELEFLELERERSMMEKPAASGPRRESWGPFSWTAKEDRPSVAEGLLREVTEGHAPNATMLGTQGALPTMAPGVGSARVAQGLLGAAKSAAPIAGRAVKFGAKALGLGGGIEAARGLLKSMYQD